MISSRIFTPRSSSPVSRWLLLLLCCSGLALVGTYSCVTAVSPQEPQINDMARVKKLEESLLSPCCYGEPVSRHMSEVAFEMRKEIAERVQAGQSDQEILDHYKLLYGEQVLVEPDGRKKVVLYSLPVLISIVGLGIVLLFLHHALRRTSSNLEPDGSEKRIDSKIAEAIRNATDDL